MVERDLPKVDVEGSKPFSRSKAKNHPIGWFFALFAEGFLRTFEEDSTKFFCGRKPMKRI